MRWAIVFAGVGGAVMVAMGAWASHGATGQTREWVEIGARYGLWHSIALLAVAAIAARAERSLLPTLAAAAFSAGILLFSGSLFIRALTEVTWVAPATPVGGLAFIAGWLLLAAWGVKLYLDDRA